jgi:hypothetical protein
MPTPLISLTQEETLDIVVKPMVQNSPIYAPLSAGGLSPVKVLYNVKDGSYLSKVTLSDWAFQSAPSTSTLISNSYTAAHVPTGSAAQWSLVKYDFYTHLSRNLLTDLKIHDNSAGELPDAGRELFNAMIPSLMSTVVTDISRHAFWSNTAFDPDTDFTGTHDFPATHEATMAANAGFVQLIKAAVTATTVTNVSTSSTNGSTISTTNVKALLDAVYRAGSYKLRQKVNSTALGMEQKPVFLVSDDVYESYKAYIETTYPDSIGYKVLGYDAEGRPTGDVKALVYKNCMVMCISDVLDDYHIHTGVSGAEYQHMVIFTERENLQVAYNFQEGLNGLSLYQRDLDKKFGIDVGLFPMMDFQIAEATSASIAVGGFQ